MKDAIQCLVTAQAVIVIIGGCILGPFMYITSLTVLQLENRCGGFSRSWNPCIQRERRTLWPKIKQLCN